MGSKGTATQAEVEEFLSIFKSCWDGNVVPRLNPNNDETLAILGIKPKHRAEEVRLLRYEDYYKGPSPDHKGDPNMLWWEFGRWIDGHEIYIKICAYKRTDGSYRAKCLSFHVPDRPLSYPLKKKGC